MDEKISEIDDMPDPDLKIILLGDSAVGKSKLIERYLMDEYNHRQLSTYALNMYRKEMRLPEDNGKATTIDFWDTAGQEAFNKMHPSYYYGAHCFILVFDVTRKDTYKHLTDWHAEMRKFSEKAPCIVVANKIDVDYNVTRKEFKFASKYNLPFHYVSAADGTNIVKVFQQAISEAKHFKESGGDALFEVLSMLSDKKK